MSEARAGQATQTSLQTARDAMGHHAWEDARDLFLDAEKAGRLSPPDLEG